MINFQKTKKILIASVVFSFIGILLYYVSPYFTGYLIDHIVMESQLDLLPMWVTLVVIFSVILHCYLFYFLKYNWDKCGILVSNEVRNRIKDKILEVPAYEYEKSTNSLMYNLIMGDSSLIGTVTLNYIASSIVSILRVMACLMILWIICPPLTVVSACFIPLYSCAMLLNRKRLQSANDAERRALDSLIFNVNKLIEGKIHINLFHKESYFDAKFTQRLGQWTTRKLRYSFWFNMTKEVPNFLTTLAPLVVLAYGAVLVNRGQLTMGQLIMFSQYVSMIFEPLNILSYVVVEKRSSVPIFDRVQHFLLKEDKKAAWPYAQPDHRLLSIRNHTVMNKNGEVLFRIPTLDLHRTGIYLLTGDNGVGKSTFLNILSSINNPELMQASEDAQCFIDQTVYSELSYLYQPGFIFEGTVEENITFGQPKGLWFDEIVQVLGIPDLEKEIVFNPINLSLGEQQKLQLARVFFHHGKMIFLDEPSTNLDVESRKRLRDYLEKLKTDRFILIITHDEEFQKIADGVLEIKDHILHQYEASQEQKCQIS